MELQDIISQLGGLELENKDALIDGIVGIVESEKQKGISSYRSKDQEALKLKNALKSLGYDHEKYTDIEDFIKSKSEQPTQNRDITKDDVELSKLRRELDGLKSELESERTQTKQLKDKSDKSKITAELMKEIGDKVYGSKWVIESLIANGTVKVVDDEIAFVDGDSVYDFKTGLSNLLEKNPDILKVQQKSGAGSTKSNQPQINTEELTRERINSMSPEELLKNIDKIKAMAGIQTRAKR